MAWYDGTAYDPTGNAAANGASQFVNGVQVIPGAPGWNPSAGSLPAIYQQMQGSLQNVNNIQQQQQQQQQPQQPAQTPQQTTPQWATDLQTQISQLMQGVGGLGGLGNWNAGMWGNQTSPVYKPNQPAPTNGWGTGWGQASPFRPTF